MPYKRIVDGVVLSASFVTLYDAVAPNVRELAYFLPWVLALPFLDSIATSLHGLHPGAAKAEPACTSLRDLHLACGLSARTSLLIRTIVRLQCVLAGYTLWRTGAPGWVSVLGLTLLTGLYAFWFTWRLNAIDDTGGLPRCGQVLPPRGLTRSHLPPLE